MLSPKNNKTISLPLLLSVSSSVKASLKYVVRNNNNNNNNNDYNNNNNKNLKKNNYRFTTITLTTMIVI